MSTAAAAELEEYPKYKQNYLKAFERMLENNRKKGIACSWNTADEVYRWWLQLDKDESGNSPDDMEDEQQIDFAG